MRSYTFDVLVQRNANGFTRTTENAHWLRLATRLVRTGSVMLALENVSFAGYGSSRDVGYTRYRYTVTEVSGAFLVA
jgi:hypothetical protein